VNYRKEKVAARVLELTDGEGRRHGDRQRRRSELGRIAAFRCDAAAGSSPAARRRARTRRPRSSACSSASWRIYGSTGGSIDEFRQLLALYARGGCTR